MTANRRLSALVVLSTAALTACTSASPASVTLAGTPTTSATSSASRSATSAPASTSSATPSATVTSLPSATPSPTEPAPTPTPTATADPSPSPTAAPGGTRGVVVYYVADSTTGPRLFSETHAHPATKAVVTQAVEAMLHDKPLDPDYTSVWPAATRLLGVSANNGVATIDLSDDVRKASVGSEFEVLALQQLFYTIRSASKGTMTGVHLRIDGKNVSSLWGHVDVSGTILARSPLTTLAPVQISSPANGATVGTTLTVRGRASAFEGTVSWQILAGQKVVKKGFTTATIGAPGRGNWTFTVTLPKGSYTVKAFESSAKDGSETFIDTKVVTVG